MKYTVERERSKARARERGPRMAILVPEDFPAYNSDLSQYSALLPVLPFHLLNLMFVGCSLTK